MWRPNGADPRRRAKLIVAWVLTVLLVGVYVALPDGDDTVPLPPAPDAAEAAERSGKPEVLEVSPPEPSPGSAVDIRYDTQAEGGRIQAYVGKDELEVLARGEASVVARLPANTPLGRAKIRVSVAGERSKPYHVRVKAPSWRKPFRALVGGLALLVFGIGVFARGVREAAGLQSAHALARVARRGPLALGIGALIGAFAQSTTAAAGLLSGLVASSLLATVAAASAFLGAQLGAATAPLVTGLIDPREGLLIVAVGVLWLAFASDRRATALSRLVLGAGLIAFGLQTLRPGFEPFVQDPTLLSLVTKLRADDLLSIGVCALLGAALVAVLQGPAPVVVLVLVLAQTTAQWDLRTALAVLSGSGFGSAVGALLTTPRGVRGRRLAQLYLALGALGTVFCAATVGVWSNLADRVVPGVPHAIEWGRRVLLPNLGLHLGVAFAFSQLASAMVLLPLVAPLARLLERVFPEPGTIELSKVGDVAGVVRRGLEGVLADQHAGIRRLCELSLEGRRDAGRFVEHRLTDAHARLEDLLTGPVLALPVSEESAMLSRAAFASLGLQRSLEGLHRQAERLVDRRLSTFGEDAQVAPLPSSEQAIVLEMHRLLDEGLCAVGTALDQSASLDLESALDREIRMNALEARARTALGVGSRDASALAVRLGVLQLVDAYEAAGNQLYRVAAAFGESYVPVQAAVV